MVLCSCTAKGNDNLQPASASEMYKNYTNSNNMSLTHECTNN